LDRRSINETYRKVFDTPEGRWVLGDILNDCGFYSLGDMESASDIARMNIGRRILGKMGIWDSPNALALIGKLLEIPIPKEEHDDEET